MYALLSYLVKILVDNFLLDVFNLARLDAVLKVHYLCTAKHLNCVDLADNCVCNIECDLTAVLAVNLVTIVLCRIV